MNQLRNEKSPYLQQHADNPVNWYPWGDEAFEKAREEDKPIFLSIGYATCHWCHVMEHESFEDNEVAGLMNQSFVNIKVDREERPDIDNTYMTVCQMLTGSGGWPLTIIMTPDKEPFYAATYIPRQSHPNRAGMLDLVPAIEKAWKEDRDRIHDSTDRIKKGFQKSLELGKSSSEISATLPEDAVESLTQRFDSENGGFGGAPKFPSPHTLLFLADYCRVNDHKPSKEMLETTLLKMRLGGLWDHIGKGFHRYSTDQHWLLPHFEKMLYDQAMQLMAYAEGWELTGNSLFKKTAYEIAEYVEECLTSPEGAFFSAEDADSEGEEGKFYVWSKSEIEAILPEKDAELFCKLYQINPDGNFRDEATGQKTGQNIPHLKESIPSDQEERVEAILKTVHRERKKRERPLLDNKILTDWNGLMIAALARAGVIFGEESFIRKAEKAWKMLDEICLVPGEKILHRIKDKEGGIDGMADDYTFAVWGLTELYSATFNPDYLVQALHIHEIFEREFYDEDHGGYFFTSNRAEKLLGRQKEIYDGAIPSSNSVAVLNGFRLSRLTGNSGPEYKARSIFKAFSDPMNDSPSGYTFALRSLLYLNGEINEIVICTKEISREVQEAIRIAREHSPAGSGILLKTPETETQLNQISDFSKNYPAEDNLTVYVCSNFSCKTPVHSPNELEELLSYGQTQ
jgi:uncharacterized protein